jgi:hypothetical protein
VVPDGLGGGVVCSAGGVKCCVGSSSLELSDTGRGAGGSSSDNSAMGSLSEGMLSPSNSWMSAHVTLRYGFLVVLSCSSSCQSPLYRVIALVFFPWAVGGLKRRTLYPCLFLLSRADMNVILSLSACTNFALLRAT